MSNNPLISTIPLYDRQRACETTELIFSPKTMRLIYLSKAGVILAEICLKFGWVSALYGRLNSTKKSQKKIARFVKKYQLDVSEIEKPLSTFSSFNDFFIRKLKPQVRPIAIAKECLISPADGRLCVYQISKDTVLNLKYHHLSLSRLTGIPDIGEQFDNGYCFVYRLAPSDMHRFCCIDDAVIVNRRSLAGYLRSVNPLSLQHKQKVFEENQRIVTTLETANLGQIVQIDVGALLVGKISHTQGIGDTVKKGEEMGFFELGGSTIVILMKKNTGQIDTDILKYSKSGVETIVKYGSQIGKIKVINES